MQNAELSLLRGAMDRANFSKLVYLKKKIKDTKVQLLFTVVEKYYEEFPTHQYISFDELETYLHFQYPSSRKDSEYNLIFKNLRNLDISDSLVSKCVEAMNSTHLAWQIIEELLPVTEGSADSSRLDKLAEWQKQWDGLKRESSNDIEFLDFEIDELFGADAERDGLDFPLPELTALFGRKPGGTIGHIFANVDTGKTSFSVHNMTHDAKQLRERGSDQIVLVLLNEEAGKRVIERSYHSLLNMTPYECEAERLRGNMGLKQKYLEAGGSHLRFIHSSSLSTRDIRNYLSWLNVRSLYIDSADKVFLSTRSGQDAPRHEFLGYLYQEYRALASEFGCDITTVAQAADSASGKRIVKRSDIASGKVDKPGEMDWAIGIGKTYDESESEMRWLCSVKNKMKPLPDEVIPVRLDIERGRYHSL